MTEFGRGLADPMTSDPEMLDIATVYLATFAPRTDAYAAYIGNSWMAIREEITPAVVVAALTRRPMLPLSAYMLTPESASHVLALDLDTEDGLGAACRVQRVMANAGVPAYVEPSRRGAHLWCTLATEPLPGIVLRRALRTFLADAGVAPSPKVELRPGQDRLPGPDSLGSALRLPTMPHPLTRQRYPMHDSSGTSLGLKLAPLLLAIDLAPAGPILAAAERWQDPTRLKTQTRQLGEPSPIAAFNAAIGVSQVLVRDWGVAHAVPGRSVRCPAHDDRSPSLSIARDDSRAWCHAPACDLHGPDGAGHDAYSLATLARTRSVA
jgi:hypothetical protein